MKVSLLQAILSILIFLVFLIVTATIALAPVLGGYPLEPYTEHLKSFASLYTGIVGIIIGYYFGKQQADDKS
jgi:hypothetical protein